MSHMMKKLSAMRKSMSARVPLAPVPVQASRETPVNAALRKAREVLDKAEAKFHTQAHAPLKAAKRALEKAEQLYSRAWHVHAKATKGR